jgi:hypothetical protein
MNTSMTSRRAASGNPPGAVVRNQKPGRRLRDLFGLLVLATLLWLAAALLYFATQPAYGPATILITGQPAQNFMYPLDWKKAPKTKFLLRQQLQLPDHFPTSYAFYPQDFLWAIAVNGHAIPAAGLPLAASSHEGRAIDLAPYLHPGANELRLEMEVRWGEAHFQMTVSPWDKYSVLLFALISAATIATTILLCHLYRIKILQPEIGLILAGVLIRHIYILGTPYFIRSYDYWGHIDYIDYVTQHLSLPPLGSNWESFQPPLYYLLLGCLTKILLALGLPQDQRYAAWQALSLIFSISVLLAGRAIAHIIYPHNSRPRLYLLAILAVAPPLVFNTARISNDSLLTLLEFLWLALLLVYWRQPTKTAWLRLSLVTALALLTKANALALVLIALLCLLLDRRTNPRQKFSSFAALLLISTAIAGWYYIPRALHTHALDAYVVGNVRNLTEQARIPHVFLKSLIFNPVKIVRYPFNEPWGPRHDYFLEVFFKTLFLGEWIKGPFYRFLARIMMLVALSLIPPFLYGLYNALKQLRAPTPLAPPCETSPAVPLFSPLQSSARNLPPHNPSYPSCSSCQYSVNSAPLLLTLAIVFLAHWLFLQAAPYLSTQDFRYSVITLVPIAAFLLAGIDLYSPHAKPIATFLLQWALLNAAIYLVTLSLGA